MKLFYVVNIDWFFISHRLPLALHALKEGYEVYVVTADTGRRSEIESYGIHFIQMPFRRSGSNPIYELKCLFRLYFCYKKCKPDLIHHITLKAALLGSLAAKLSGVKNVVNAISGLGYNFTDNRKGFLQRVVRLMINIAFKSESFSYILQNPDDVNMIQQLHLVETEHIYLIKGSGIDLIAYAWKEPINKKKLRVLFSARILRDKGILELIEAAMTLKKDYESQIEFILAGDCDKENLAVLPKEELLKKLIPGYITWIGFQKEMYSVYVDSDIVVLPSYREGLPKSLIEACAVGRPIVTTNVPGCRECVVEGTNGWLVPAKDSQALADVLKILIDDGTMRHEFGIQSRILAEREFSIDCVVDKTFDIYKNYYQ